jgi:hypothetical protein
MEEPEGEEEPEEEEVEKEPEVVEVFSEEMSMNQLDTSKEKPFAKCFRGMLFDDDGDTPLMSSEPHTPNVTGALTRRAMMTMMMTTSGCR